MTSPPLDRGAGRRWRDHVDRGFPYAGFARGWYQLGWSRDLAVGNVAPLRFFDDDLVMYRDKGGIVRVMDAYCAHYGAHLGYGGVVESSGIRCPFHAWLWDHDGRNVEVPYGEGRCSKRTIKMWTVREHGGLIFVWYPSDSGTPEWDLPPLPDEAARGYFALYPLGIHHEIVHFPGQFIGENIADLAHLKFVHRFEEVPALRECVAAGPVFRTVFDGMTPTSRGHAPVLMTQEAYGVGLIRTETAGPIGSVTLAGLTPIDHGTTMVMFSRWMECPDPSMEGQQPAGKALRYIENNTAEALGPNSDRPIWDHMRYLTRPAYTREEIVTVRRIREWMRPFYDVPSVDEATDDLPDEPFNE